MSAAAREPAAVSGASEDATAWSARGRPDAVARVAAAPRTLGGLAVAGLLGAVASGEAALVALAAPAAVAAAAGLARAAAASVEVAVTVDRLTTVEGEPVAVSAEITGDRAIDRLEVALDVDGALAGAPLARAVRLRRGQPRRLRLEVPCPRWGIGTVRAVVLRWRDPAGVVTRTARQRVDAVVRVLPAPETLRTLVRHDETQIAAGNAVARELGQGVEFGEVRRYAPGDRLQSINWRVSARREGLWVTDRHLERNVDVVLLVDAVLPSALVPAVRAAAALCDAYLAERDRVGLASLGGTTGWLRPGSAAQRHRLVEALLEAQALPVEAPGGGLFLPPRLVPPGALAIAVSSLLDDRSAAALVRLRDRGSPMAVIEVDSGLAAAAAPGPEGLADRLWRLTRDARRERLRARGVPVARWRDGEPLEAAMAEIAAFRRALRRPGA